jgi:hypothetical protein
MLEWLANLLGWILLGIFGLWFVGLFLLGAYAIIQSIIKEFWDNDLL